MCNCGKKRTGLSQQANTSINNRTQVQAPPMQVKQTVVFQYTGNTALTVTGSITRKNYRFNFPGDIQHIDFKDAAAMTAIPVVKRV